MAKRWRALIHHKAHSGGSRCSKIARVNNSFEKQIWEFKTYVLIPPLSDMFEAV